MEAVPLIPKAKVLPNLDTAPLIRDLFQDEFQTVVPTKKLSQNILTSLENPDDEEDQETYNSVEFQNLTNRRKNIIKFTENVLQAYKNHEKNLEDIKNAEEHIFETHVHFLNREKIIVENQTIRELLTLKRQPVFKALDVNYVRKYKLLQGEAGLPPEHELKSDFRVQNFKKWRKRLKSNSQDSLHMTHLNRVSVKPENYSKLPRWSVLSEKKKTTRKPQKTKNKNKNESGKPPEIFKAEPKVVFFSDYKLGDVYLAEIKVKNIHQKGIQFQLKPMCLDGPFRVMLSEKSKTTVSPGLSFYLNVEFTPKSLDNSAEDIVIATEDGNRFLIPLIAYLEPPILKTHKDINEFSRTTADKILNSYIECGVCFTGDTKVTKLSFRCYRGSGEFFIMTSENWNRNHINTLTVENLLEIPPFRVYPVFFKIEKDEVIDLFVEFNPKNSGTHVENIVIACNNGQIRSLDLIGDAVGWHSFYFSFQDSLLKELPPEEDDDVKVKYYLDFEDTSANGKVEKVFCVSNNSDTPFDFQWKIREANIMSTKEKYLRLSRDQVKIDPESGTFEPNSIWEFLVTITFNNSEVGKYRMVLSLYVLNLPYQSIEEDDTIIQPTGFVRNLYSQSLYGEEEASALSPELSSLQGTYESLQESIKSYVEYQNKTQPGPRYDFCRTTCIPNPGLCAKPLKKSKTYFNIGDNLDDGDGLGCVCRHRPPEADSNSESCNSNPRDERGNELSPLRNEVIWDFVDILVDEVELWVDVFPTRVTLEPSVIELSRPLNVKDQTVFKEVRIINHNRSPVTCTWFLPSEIKPAKRISNGPGKDQTSFALIFDKQGGTKNKKSEDSVNLKQRSQKSEQDDESKTETENKDAEDLSSCKISIKPKKDFKVGGLSEFTCKIGISPSRAGDIKDMLRLSVNEGDLELKVLIFGTVITRAIETSPDILDFGVLKQGTRYIKDFLIANKTSNSLLWRINQFDFDFEIEKFFGQSGLKPSGSIKNTSGVIMKKEKSATESYCLDARVPGIKCSLLEIQESNESCATLEKQYILVLGDVKIPSIFLSAPRFENAILAPPGKMYVGQKISTKVTLTNVGSVETFFSWGHSFGCHSRKLNVEFSPKSCRIEKNNKLTVNIDLTALEEGIISHCYIPCFFCRSAEPLILSIVGLAENVKVTFEIIDYPMQTHADPRTFLKSPFYHTVLRVSWPMKTYNPCLGLNCINEYCIQRMICRCQDVDEEATRAFGAPKDSAQELEKKTFCTSAKSDQSLKSLEISYESSVKSRNFCDKKSKVKLEEDLKCSLSNLSCLNSLDRRKSGENSALSYNYIQPSLESLQFCTPRLEFLNVPYQTATLRQFVIRNETAIETSFQIKVFTHGVSENLPDRRVVMIKNRVFGYSKDDFQSKLTKEQPLVVVVEPSQGELKAFDAVCINVYCYGNTWGEYRDRLICTIKGIEPYHLNLFIQIVGHPIYFPMFRTEALQKPILRFQALTYIEKPVSKQVKVVNRSAIPLNVSWLVFLTKPLLKEEDREDSFNLCADSNANFDSTHSGEGSAESSKNYIPKNASERTSSFRISNEPTDSAKNSDFFKSMEKLESSLSSPSMKKEKRESNESEKGISSIANEGMKSDLPHFILPGRPDGNFFKVEPKEMSFEPFEEKKMSVTFDPHFCKPESFPEEFQGVLTCCVKLKPEDEKCPGLYYRPCGIKFVSELMDFNALVEIPFLTFEILRGDLKFIVDANAVVKSERRNFSVHRKFIIKNQNQKLLYLKIEVSPGSIFKVTHVNTLDKFYPKYNPDVHNLKIDSGQLLEMELECSIAYKDILYAFEELKRKRKQDQCQTPFEVKSLSKSSNEYDEEPHIKKEPWRDHIDDLIDQNLSGRCSLGHKDSLELNINRMSTKSDLSCCDNFDDVETEGEFMELSKMQEAPCRTKPPRHVTVVQEEISFIQSGLVTQSMMAELHISFPAIKISQKSLDFGNVFLGETALRYCTLINLTGFPTDFRVMAKINSAEFVASPLTGSLPSADYNSDIGKTITIEFKPSQPGYFKELYHVYCNLDLEFDFYEVFVSGFGTWNEKYKTPKFDTYTKLQGIYPNLKK